MTHHTTSSDRGGESGIDWRKVPGYRIDVRPHGSGPDETEGRMIARAEAEAEARRSIAMTRKVRMKKDDEP